MPRSTQACRATSIFKKSWVLTVLKAHGVASHWRKPNYTDLTAEVKERFRAINLHWHDLRHEYASRLVERGVPLAQVRDLLGHASTTTTERYDNQTLAALQAAVGRLEAGKTFEPQTDPEHKVSSFYQDRAGDASTGASTVRPATTDKLSKEEQLAEWYRYGDSNPGSVAENHVS